MSLEPLSSFFPILQSPNSQQESVTPDSNSEYQLHSNPTVTTTPVPLPVTDAPIRKTQHVLSQAQRYKIVTFMMNDANENGLKGVCARAIKHFPQFFHGKSNTIFTRAMRYWEDRDTIVERYKQRGKRGNRHYYTKTPSHGVKMLIRKVDDGRGRKRPAWCSALHKDLVNEFHRLRNLGVRFNRRLLQVIAKKLVLEGHSDFYGPTVCDLRTGGPIIEKITFRWVQAFMQSHNICSRTQTGKLSVSPSKQELIEREVAFHLGQVSRDFISGGLDEGFVFNSYETHFVFNMHNHRTLAMRGDENVKYADVISGTDGMTMMVTISGGERAMLSPAFMIFKNENRSHPIKGVPDNVAGVAYRSGPKGWMDATVFRAWVQERRVLGKLPNGKKRIYMDNCSGHKTTPEVEEILESINTEIRFFPKNATDLCQPADSFIIQKLKTVWRRVWDEKKLQMINDGMWGSAMTGSGKLANLGKKYFLKLAADVVWELNGMRDKDRVLYTRKAMIKCGLSKNFNGVWEVEQLFRHLQAIVQKYRENFDGTPVTSDTDLDAERTESESE